LSSPKYSKHPLIKKLAADHKISKEDPEAIEPEESLDSGDETIDSVNGSKKNSP